MAGGLLIQKRGLVGDSSGLYSRKILQVTVLTCINALIRFLEQNDFNIETHNP